MSGTAPRVYTRGAPSGGAGAPASRQLGMRRAAAGPCRKSRAACTPGVGLPTSARPLGALLPGNPSRVYTRDALSGPGAAPAPLQQARRPGGMSPMSGTACRVYTRDAISGSARQPAGGAGRAGGPREGPPRWPPRSTGPPSPSLALGGPSARGRHGSLGAPPQSTARGAINLQTLAANSRSEHSHPDSAAMEASRVTSPSCQPAISQAMAANPRCEHSYPSPAANQVRNDGQMAASSRRECSFREVAATLQGGRCPLGPSTC